MKHVLNFRPNQQPETRGVKFGNCETHGEYPLTTIENGVERWYPPYCRKCEQQRRADSLFARSAIGKRHESCTFDNFDIGDDLKKARNLKQCRRYVDELEKNINDGSCVVMHGNPGTGKNHLAAAICKSAMKKGYSALLVSAIEYLETYWGTSFGEKSRFLDALTDVDILILDEAGRIPDKPAAAEGVFLIIDRRNKAMRPTILLANLDREALVKRIGLATYERLAENGGMRVVFDYESYRTKDVT